MRAAKLLYPRGPRFGPGYAVPVHHHLPGPIRPTHRHSTTSPHSGLYALPSLCARLRRLGDPRVVPCFRWHPFSTCRPPGPREAQRLPIPSSFAADAGLRLKGKVSALPTSPHSDSRGGGPISWLHYGSLSLRPVDLFALLSELTRPSPSQQGLLLPGFRRIGHPLRRRISLRWQLGKFHRRDFHPLAMPTSIAAAPHGPRRADFPQRVLQS